MNFDSVRLLSTVLQQPPFLVIFFHEGIYKIIILEQTLIKKESYHNCEVLELPTSRSACQNIPQSNCKLNFTFSKSRGTSLQLLQAQRETYF